MSMSSEELKATIGSAVEGAYNRGDLKPLDSVYAANLILHRPPYRDIKGLVAYKQYLTQFGRAFSDLHFTIGRIVLQNDTHAGLWALEATHTGQSPALPVPPRGRRVSITGSVIGLWADGRIIEEWNYADWLGLFQQLGVIPPMG
jgi:predicted ester cyclase